MRLWQDGGCLRESVGSCDKKKRGGETNILKGEQAGSRGGCLKELRAGTPLRTIVSILVLM